MTPQTEAGRALAEALGPGDVVGGEAVRVIAAIEAEARAAALEEAIAAVEALPVNDDIAWAEDEPVQAFVLRAAVLEALRGKR